MRKRYTYNLRAVLILILLTELILNGLLLLFYFVIRKQLSGLIFEKEYLFWLLVLGPVMSIIFIAVLQWKNKTLVKFGDPQLLPFFAQPLSSSKTTFKYLLVRLAVCFAIIGMINPRIGNKVAEGKTQGIDIIFCLDVSNSMLAQDIKPSRLVRAKRGMEQIIDKLHGHRIGIVVFAGDAYVQLPLTSDYGAAKLFLSTIQPDLIPVQGTAIGKAIDLAMQSFDFEKQKEGKAIVLITDGENHEDDAVAAAEHAADNNVPVYCIGMGTAAGSPIPVVRNGRQVDFKKDKEGQVIVSRLNEEAMAAIASAGKGIYISSTTQDMGVESLVKKLDQQTKNEVDTLLYVDYEDRFQWFLGAALLLLLVETLLTEKKSKWTEKINWFNA